MVLFKIRFATAVVLGLSLSVSAQAAQKKPTPRTVAKAVRKAAPAKAPARAVSAKAAPAKATGRAPASVAKTKPDTTYKVRMPAAAAFLPGSGSGGMANIGGVAESDRAIQVNGQARNLSMMLTLRNEKDRIKFVEIRRDFKPEISQTQY